MASILLAPVVPNLTKLSSGEHFRDLWKLFTKVKDCTQGGRRLENLFWRLWYQSSTTGAIKEQQISNFLVEWKEDGDSLNLSKFKGLSSCEASHELIQAPCSSLVEETSIEKPLEPVNISEDSFRSTSAVPSTTHSIQIARTNSTLKAPNFPAIPVAPVVPRTIQPKKSLVNTTTTTCAPKVSVGFTSAVDPSNVKLTRNFKRENKLPSIHESSNLVMNATVAKPQIQQFSTEKAKPLPKKKFFITDSESFDSSEGEYDSDTESKSHRDSCKISKVLDTKESPKIPPDPFSKVDPGAEFRESNLSNLLKAPRRPASKFSLFAISNPFGRSRNDDYFAQAPQQQQQLQQLQLQQFDSESLKRGIQMDRKASNYLQLNQLGGGYKGEATGTMGPSLGEVPSVW